MLIIRTVLLFTFLLFAGYVGSLLKGWPLLILWAMLVLFQIRVDNNKSLRIMVKYQKKLRVVRRLFPELAYMPLEDNRPLAAKLANRSPAWIISVFFIALNILSGGAAIRAVFGNMMADPVTSLSIDLGFCLILAFRQVVANNITDDKDTYNRFLIINRIIMIIIVIITFVLMGISKRWGPP